MADTFDSAWLKWGRAVVHAQELQKQLAIETDAFKREPLEARTEYDAKRHCVSLKLVHIDPFPRILSLLLGDVANNFRAALDHLAWALVTTRPKRAMEGDERSRIYFPLCRSEKAFEDHLVAGQLLSDRDRAIVRRYQPFWHTARSRPHAKSKIKLHCLSVLPDINRDDKHKFLRAVWAWPKSGRLNIGEPVDCAITRVPQRARGIILQPDAEIQRVYVRRTGPNPDVYMDAELAVEPTFDGRVNLDSWLAQTTVHVQGLLGRFAKPPRDILRLGIVSAATQAATPPAS